MPFNYQKSCRAKHHMTLKKFLETELAGAVLVAGDEADYKTAAGFVCGSCGNKGMNHFSYVGQHGERYSVAVCPKCKHAEMY